MKVLLDIKDEKAEFILELLGDFKYVKAHPLTPYKADVLYNIKQGVEEMNRVNEGKIKPTSARDLLDEL